MKKALIAFLIIVAASLLLPFFFKALRFDFISGSDHLPAASLTKDESIMRGVYLGEVRLISSPYKLGDTLDIEIVEGWIEKPWRSGTWYWTTIVEGYGCTIRIISPSNPEQKGKLVIRNNKSTGWGLEGLGYAVDGFGGHLSELPESDTIRYNILRKNNLDFSKENVIGVIEFLIVRNP
jgi:hypothetical protein